MALEALGRTLRLRVLGQNYIIKANNCNWWFCLRESYQNAEGHARYTQLSQDLEDRDMWPAQTRGTKRIRRRSVLISEERLAKAVGAYQTGRALRELAQEFSVNRARLTLLFRASGVALRPRGPNIVFQPRDQQGRYVPKAR